MNSEFEVDNIDLLINDRKKFEEFIYTPIDQAIKELDLRRKDQELTKKVHDLFGGDIPETLKKQPKAVLFRQLATPNYEVRRFVSIALLTEVLKPLLWEYYEDKFTSNNEWKHSLGKLKFYKGMGGNNTTRFECMNVVEFNKSVGKKISEVRTFNDESLINFHHRLFDETFSSFQDRDYFDASSWFKKHGETAKNYYLPFLGLFLQNAVLFENFILDYKELEFTKEVFLPAFLEIYKRFGIKPLIVALEPTNLEGEVFWMCHPFETKKVVEEYIKK